MRGFILKSPQDTRAKFCPMGTNSGQARIEATDAAGLQETLISA
jgi:hypothetical protein